MEIHFIVSQRIGIIYIYIYIYNIYTSPRCIYYRAYVGHKPPNHSNASVRNRSNHPHPHPAVHLKCSQIIVTLTMSGTTWPRSLATGESAAASLGSSSATLLPSIADAPHGWFAATPHGSPRRGTSTPCGDGALGPPDQSLS
jgi:hypothetical protein